jgi:hypothetical protein
VSREGRPAREGPKMSTDEIERDDYDKLYGVETFMPNTPEGRQYLDSHFKLQGRDDVMALVFTVLGWPIADEYANHWYERVYLIKIDPITQEIVPNIDTADIVDDDLEFKSLNKYLVRVRLFYSDPMPPQVSFSEPHPRYTYLEVVPALYSVIGIEQLNIYNLQNCGLKDWSIADKLRQGIPLLNKELSEAVMNQLRKRRPRMSEEEFLERGLLAAHRLAVKGLPFEIQTIAKEMGKDRDTISNCARTYPKALGLIGARYDEVIALKKP